MQDADQELELAPSAVSVKTRFMRCMMRITVKRSSTYGEN
ncbi:hypothetical protein P606_21310 [Comamonas thiooxydans]|nr:hypothetical protein P369_10310 [Comamonas thiooxydans]KGG98373.1 hypothetical protein P367_12575 [Comamonas thiooxydans]KGH20216.1 hypothetical protein P606_21310 [Comamonas thiooxydans]